MLHRAEVFVDVGVGDAVLNVRFSFGDLHGNLAADRSDLAFEIAQSRFFRVAGRDFHDAAVGPDDRHFFDPVLFHLLRDEMLLRDHQFFFVGVAGEADDFHAIEEGRLDRVEHVRGDDEHHV